MANTSFVEIPGWLRSSLAVAIDTRCRSIHPQGSEQDHLDCNTYSESQNALTIDNFDLPHPTLIIDNPMYGQNERLIFASVDDHYELAVYAEEPGQGCRSATMTKGMVYARVPVYSDSDPFAPGGHMATGVNSQLLTPTPQRRSARSPHMIFRMRRSGHVSRIES